ncbi:MAG: NAD(P)-dependent oxidoreductase [Gemmobacter sp.]|jgi:nucleoside-diphosphate-sugar epimerase|nr:NAD(P)-dependent oxidoreductase [Gemmobacter sp.]
MKRLKIVVTGGSGRVGRQVVACLAEAHEVVNADLAPPAGACPARYVRADVMQLDDLHQAFEGADVVIHLAGLDYDWGCPDEAYINVNTRGSWHVLQAAEAKGVGRVVLCSSISICGLQEMRPDWKPRSLPITEEHENRPVYAYGVSKQIAEVMGQSFARRGRMEVVSLRPLAVVMPETLPGYIDFVDTPDRHWLFYYVTAADLARAFRAAAETPGLNGESFYIGADDSSHPEATLEWTAHVLGDLPADRDKAWFAANPRASVFSNAKARRLLGWSPTSDFNALRRHAGGLEGV